MPTEQDAVVVGGAYKESDDHVPNPTHQFGTVDTSGTAGTAHSRIEEVSPIFDVADAQNAVTAARALDPDDKDVDESLVNLPAGQVLEVVDKDAVRERIQAKADAVVAEPVEVGGPTKAQKEAAESGGTGAQTAQEQQQESGAGSSEPSTDTGRQTGGEPPKEEAPKPKASQKDK